MLSSAIDPRWPAFHWSRQIQTERLRHGVLLKRSSDRVGVITGSHHGGGHHRAQGGYPLAPAAEWPVPAAAPRGDAPIPARLRRRPWAPLRCIACSADPRRAKFAPAVRRKQASADGEISTAGESFCPVRLPGCPRRSWALTRRARRDAPTTSRPRRSSARLPLGRGTPRPAAVGVRQGDRVVS